MAENEVPPEVEVEEPLLLDITEDMYVGSLQEEIINKFTCMLCYGIVHKPIKCLTCDTLVCKSCIPAETLKLNRFVCFLKCTSNMDGKINY